MTEDASKQRQEPFLTQSTQRTQRTNMKNNPDKPALNEVSGVVVDCAVQIHRKLGPGLLESTYRMILAHELHKRGLLVEQEVSVPIEWDGLKVETGFRADMIVEDAVIIELKSVEQITALHKKQLFTYMRLADKRLGLLINFGQVLLKDGIVRIVN